MLWTTLCDSQNLYVTAGGFALFGSFMHLCGMTGSIGTGVLVE
jgi:hypothetical protein